MTTAVIVAFSELSEKQQAEAIAMEQADPNYLDYTWWDAVYEDFIEVCERMGLDLSTDDIHFQGFWSQGDGASFGGMWGWPVKGSIVANIREYASGDAELIRIARELWDAQRRNFYRLFGRITKSGRDAHEMSMRLELSNDAGYSAPDKYEAQVLEALRDLARWLYARLEEEYDYLMSDEAVRQHLLANEVEYEVDGPHIRRT